MRLREGESGPRAAARPHAATLGGLYGYREVVVSSVVVLDDVVVAEVVVGVPAVDVFVTAVPRADTAHQRPPKAFAACPFT